MATNGIHATPPKIPGSIRFISFNVCGLRNVMNYEPWSRTKTLTYMFEQFRGDVLCFQEVRVQEKDMPYNLAVVPGYTAYQSFPHEKKGYSGVGIYVNDQVPVFHAEDGLTGWLKSKDVPSKTYRDLEQDDLDELLGNSDMNESSRLNMPPPTCIGGYPEDVDEALGLEVDSEGRSVVLDLGFSVVFGLYCPANSLGNKEDFRTNYFRILDKRIRKLVASGREVVVMGDLNVARELYDNADAMEDYFKTLGRPLFLSRLNMRSFETIHLKATNEWKVSSPQRLMMQEWLGSLPKNHQKPRDVLRDVVREKHPTRMNMYTCECEQI